MVKDIVKGARQAAGLTQRDLADRAGVSEGIIRRIEGGEGTTLATMTAIADALGLSARERAQCLGAA